MPPTTTMARRSTPASPSTASSTVTASAVRRWQAAIGVEETGVVRPGDVVVVTGPGDGLID